MRYRKVYRIAGWQWALDIRRDVQEYPVYERRWYWRYNNVPRGLGYQVSRRSDFRFYTLLTPLGELQWGWYWGWHTHELRR